MYLTSIQNRERLIAMSPSNRETLDNLSTSLLALSLDTYTLPSIPTSDPLHQPAVDAQIRNSATGIKGGENRWFDKPISVLVETNGRAGMMGEHSPVDALIPSIVVQYVLAEPVKRSKEPIKASGEGWKALKWETDDGVLTDIEEARGRNMTIVQDSDASQLWWNEYGVDWIKKNGEC